MNRKYLDEMWG